MPAADGGGRYPGSVDRHAWPRYVWQRRDGEMTRGRSSCLSVCRPCACVCNRVCVVFRRRRLLLCVSLALPWAGTTVTPESDATNNGWLNDKSGGTFFPIAGREGGLPRGLPAQSRQRPWQTELLGHTGHEENKVGEGSEASKVEGCAWLGGRAFCDCVGTWVYLERAGLTASASASAAKCKLRSGCVWGFRPGGGKRWRRGVSVMRLCVVKSLD